MFLFTKLLLETRQSLAINNTYDAFVRGFDIVVEEDEADTFTEDEHRSGLECMERMYVAKIKKVSDILGNLRH